MTSATTCCLPMSRKERRRSTRPEVSGTDWAMKPTARTPSLDSSGKMGGGDRRTRQASKPMRSRSAQLRATTPDHPSAATRRCVRHARLHAQTP